MFFYVQNDQNWMNICWRFLDTIILYLIAALGLSAAMKIPEKKVGTWPEVDTYFEESNTFPKYGRRTTKINMRKYIETIKKPGGKNIVW